MINLPADLTKIRNNLRSRVPDLIGTLRARAAEHAPEVAPREAGYRIANAAGADGDTAVVRIYDEIWWLGVSADDLVRDLDAITASKIRVEINSPGGDVFDGIAIYNALRHHSAHVTTRVDGIAASIASVIAQAGDHRVMTSAAQMMIHNAWGYTVGDSRDHTEMAALLDQQDDVIAGIYASRSGGDLAHFRELMDAETWLTDQRAVDEGLADEVVDPARQTTDEPSDRNGRTLHAEISEAVSVVADAVSSAERVVALRADAGKDLSTRNAESLVGLRDALGRLDALLTPPPPTCDVDISGEYARFVANLQGV